MAGAGQPVGDRPPRGGGQVNFGGQVETVTDEAGVETSTWVPEWNVLGVSLQHHGAGLPQRPGEHLAAVELQATQAFDLSIFNAGDYAQAVRPDLRREHQQGALPRRLHAPGQELRLQQQYFFVACSLRDFIDNQGEDFDLRELPQRVIFLQLNDTHPVIVVPELMRILIDERGFDWDEAWAITSKCLAYTCHTLLPEALEVYG